VSARSGRRIPVTGDGDRSRRRCAGRGGRLPAGARRRWACCPHPPGVERRAPSSRSSRDDRGRTAATAVSAMMARPSDPRMYQASIRRAAGVRSTAPGPCEAAQHVRASVVSVPTVLAGHQLGEPAACRSQSGAVCDLQARAPMASSPLPPDGPGWSRLVLVRPAPQGRDRSQPPPAPQRCQAGGLLRELAHQLGPP
jgi:hypothetical protein